MGGITPVWFFGFDTPLTIVWVIARTLPLHPAHVPPTACPKKMRPPNATWSGDAPGGIGSGLAPAFGWMPSGGNGLPDVDACAEGGGGGAAAIPVALFAPWKVTRQMRPP